jgi:hypothetical protein
VMPLRVVRFPSAAKMWRSLSRESADFAFTRVEVERALRLGRAAPKPHWVRAFERDCLRSR